MAQRFEDQFQDKLDIKTREQFAALDLADATKKMYDADDIQSPLQIAAIQAGMTAEIVESLTTFINDNTDGITAAQTTALNNIASRSHLASKQLQELSHQSYENSPHNHPG